MKILGRTIEHLGTQMYKHRAPSIAELIANCWDAGAKNVRVTIPSESDYSQLDSIIEVLDDGEGMNAATIEDSYLVVGRNRRAEGGDISHGRKVMGRKGIGKLAGFGLASRVIITTWTSNMANAIRFEMPLESLRTVDGEAEDIEFRWSEAPRREGWPESGTCIELSGLRHTTPIDIESLRVTLARRFSRTTRGEMQVQINAEPLSDPEIPTMHEFPDDGEFQEEELPGGEIVRYRYAFAERAIRSAESQGFAIYAHGRTAQAPPFFFRVESTASSQHSTRYLHGEIIADYLDDLETDLISTDRQELDWEKEELRPLRVWGEALTRRLLVECGEMMGGKLQQWILNDSEFAPRLAMLDPSNKRQISSFLKVLGQKSDRDDNRTRELASSLIRAYEFRTFHDVIEDIQDASDDPDRLEETLARLHDWKVLESRAILEIVKGRLGIIDKLHRMIIGNAPETASKLSYDNLHDLLAQYPWLFDPDWQVFTEEKHVGAQLREWGRRDCPEEMKLKRVDFLAFEKDTTNLIIIEMKRPGVAVSFPELRRLEDYQIELMRAHENCQRVLVYGGKIDVPKVKWDEYLKQETFKVLTWTELFRRAKMFYEHYRAVLEGDFENSYFLAKQKEVARTRHILETDSSHRSAEDRAGGVGESDP
ncbi:ATP-binding protein [Thalassoroseus pseudoceratinae]|uniref:ATP-binding protein n=1 Tax=Thalassoroseus pseudoceratinae TaxID=2713176 RepID=UPI001420409C|nr:ATP-binding protein [Thalassoroseus pseudoceratinae]